jgi:hypothetical protein
MIFKVDDEQVLELTDSMQNVLKYYMLSETFDDEMKRMAFWCIKDKYENSFKKFKAEWEPKLIADGATSIPVDEAEFAALVFAREDYKDRSTREAEAEAAFE